MSNLPNFESSFQVNQREFSRNSLQATCIAPSSEPQRRMRDDKPEPEKRRSTVLLVSEDHQLCSMVRSFLEHAGLAVFICSGVERAESTFLHRRDIDLWIIDADSLGAHGLYLAVRLRDLLADAPILLFTGEELNRSILLTLVHNRWSTLEKPVSPTRLLAAVHNVLTGIKKNRTKTLDADIPPSEDKHRHSQNNIQLQSDWLAAFTGRNILNCPPN